MLSKYTEVGQSKWIYVFKSRLLRNDFCLVVLFWQANLLPHVLNHGEVGLNHLGKQVEVMDLIHIMEA